MKKSILLAFSFCFLISPLFASPQTGDWRDLIPGQKPERNALTVWQYYWDLSDLLQKTLVDPKVYSISLFRHLEFGYKQNLLPREETREWVLGLIKGHPEWEVKLQPYLEQSPEPKNTEPEKWKTRLWDLFWKTLQNELAKK